MERLPRFSALLTVYAGESPVFLDECLASIAAQELMPDEVVVIQDGRITHELAAVLDKYLDVFDGRLHITGYSKNRGRGYASNMGINRCTGDIIIKIDSDDLYAPEMFRTVVACFAADKALDIMGSFLTEFDNETGREIALKKTPVTHEEILAYSRMRSPFNNSGLAFRRSTALAVGGYNDLERCEDYDFAVRMLAYGAKSANLPRPLVRCRVTKAHMKRRGSWGNTRYFVKVRLQNYMGGFCTLREFLLPCAMQVVLFILPSGFTGWFYQRFLR